MEVTSRGPFLRDALIMSRSPSYNVAVSGRSKTLLRCGTRSLQRFGRFGISAGGYSPQTKGVIEFGGWSRESQALFFCFSYIPKKKTMLQRTPPFLSKSRQRFSRLYPFYFWLHPLTTFLLLLCSTASNAAAALASILRQQALEVSVPTGEMRMHKNPFNHREVRMECIQILSTKRSRKN